MTIQRSSRTSSETLSSRFVSMSASRRDVSRRQITRAFTTKAPWPRLGGATPMPNRRMLIITTCTSKKATLSEDERVPAEQLYQGEQHRRLMGGVRALRAARPDRDLDLRILSAG